MAPAPADDSVGPWAEDKLRTLKTYLDYYTTRLKNATWCKNLYYIDGFAGPGLSRLRTPKSVDTIVSQTELFIYETERPVLEEIKFVKGSPRVALELRNPFSQYVFIEKAAVRIEELNSLQKEFGKERTITIWHGDANQRIQTFLKSGIDWRYNKGVVFLDPFGMQISWSTIDDIARTRGLETIINFPFAMAINRLMVRSGRIPRAWQNRLDATFGSGDWRELVYEVGTDLLGTTLTTKRQDAAERVLRWFTGRLRESFGYASSAQLIKNTRGNPLYYLIWAGPRKEGFEGAEYILGSRKKLSRRR